MTRRDYYAQRQDEIDNGFTQTREEAAMTTEERLERLEKELTCAKRYNHWLLVVVALYVGIGVVAWAFMPGKVLAQTATTTPKEVRANKFVLEDENGKVRTLLITDKDCPRLIMYDANGKVRTGLAVLADMAGLSLYSEEGEGRTMLRADKDGKDRCRIGAASTGSPDGRTTNYPESSILLCGPDGKTIWSAP